MLLTNTKASELTKLLFKSRSFLLILFVTIKVIRYNNATLCWIVIF